MSNLKRLPTSYSYSSAVVAGDYVFLAHHRGFGDTFPEQLDSAFVRLSETLANLGLKTEDLVKVHVWLRNIEDLPEMEKRFNGYFGKDGFPARMTSTTEFIDADCLLMLEGIAYGRAGS